MRQPDERLLAMWREIGEAIESGDVQGIFVVWQSNGAIPATGAAFRSCDTTQLLNAVREHALRVRSRLTH